jgi:hypothetical protein
MQFNQRDDIARRGTRLSGSRYPRPGAAGDVLQGSDAGSVGPHRSSWGALAVDICPHPYALRKLTPSMSFASSRSPNANANTAHSHKQTVAHCTSSPQPRRKTTQEPNPQAPVEATSVRPSKQEFDSVIRRVYAAFDYTQWQIPSDSMDINKPSQNQTESRSSAKSNDLTAGPDPSESDCKVPALPGPLPAKASAAACVPPFLLL